MNDKDNIKKILNINNISIPLDNIYKSIHQSVLFDKRIQIIRNYFDKKYNINISVAALNNNNDKLINNVFHTDEWGQYNWDSYKKNLKLNIFYHPLWLETMNELINVKRQINPHPLETKIIEGILGEARSITLFSSIIGKRIQNYTTIIYNEKSNFKLWIGFSFNKGNLNDISYETYLNLMTDFQNMTNILDPFMSFFEQNNKINDSNELEKIIKNDFFNHLYFTK